jgi:hypothetical protein
VSLKQLHAAGARVRHLGLEPSESVGNSRLDTGFCHVITSPFSLPQWAGEANGDELYKSKTTFSELVGSAGPMWLHRAA